MNGEEPARTRLIYPLALAALAAIWLVMFLFGGGSLDGQLYEAIYAGHRPALVTIARLFTALGQPGPLVIAGFLVAGFLWWRAQGRLALALMLVILIGRGLSEVQKYTIARARPALEPHLVVVKTSSFPSGHATSSMIFYLDSGARVGSGGPLAAPGSGRRNPAIAAHRPQPCHAGRALAERRRRRLVVRASMGFADLTPRRAFARRAA